MLAPCRIRVTHNTSISTIVRNTKLYYFIEYQVNRYCFFEIVGCSNPQTSKIINF